MKSLLFIIFIVFGLLNCVFTQNSEELNYDTLLIEDSLKFHFSYEKNYFSSGQLRTEGLCINKYAFHGEWKAYFKNGSLKSKTNYLNGKKDGQEVFYSNGQIVKSVEYSRGKKNGQSKKFYANGEVKLIKYYKKGKLIKKYRPGENADFTTNKNILFYGKTRFSPLGF